MTVAAQTNAPSINDGGYYRICAAKANKVLYVNSVNNTDYLISSQASAADDTDVFQFNDATDGYTISCVGKPGNYYLGAFANSTLHSKPADWLTISTTAKTWNVTHYGSSANYSTAWTIGEVTDATQSGWMNYNSKGAVLKYIVVDKSSEAEDENSYFYLYPLDAYTVNITGATATVTVTANSHTSKVTTTGELLFVDAAATLTTSMVEVSDIQSGYLLSRIEVNTSDKTINVTLSEKLSAGYYRIYSSEKSKYLFADESKNGVSVNQPATGNDTDIFQINASDDNYTIATVGVANNYVSDFRTSSENVFGGNSGYFVQLSTTSKTWQVTHNPYSTSNYDAWCIGETTDGVTLLTENWWNTNVKGDKGGVLKYKVRTNESVVTAEDAASYFTLIPMSAYTLTIVGETEATVTVTANDHSSAATTDNLVYIDDRATSSASLTVTATVGGDAATATITGFNTTNKTIEVMVGGYSRTFATSGQNYTVCLPFALTNEQVSNINGKFYELNSYTSEKLKFTEVSSTEIYKPYIFVPSANYVNITGSITAYNSSEHGNLTTTVSENAASFIGTVAPQALISGTNTYYGYSSDGTFKKVSTTNGAHINSFRAYISIPGTSISAPAMLNIDFGGNTTGIVNAVKSEEIKEKSYYDLQGRRVQQPTKGLYIVNGKKVIIK